MVGELRRVLVCTPEAAGWGNCNRVSEWQRLGFLHEPCFEQAQGQHAQFCRELENAGAELVNLRAAQDVSLDAVYAHDASLMTDFGAVLMRPGKRNREIEAYRHRELYRQLNVPIAGEIRAPGTSEAGDMVWLDGRTLLVGHGYRTNREGIEQMQALLAPYGVEVISAPLPHGPGPAACLHLMSLMSLLDEGTCLVDLPWLAVETVELLKARGYRFIDIDSSERDTLACNVLSLGGKRLLAIAENVHTNEKLRDAGFEVRTFSGCELCVNGSGGPTCLTRPLLRV